MGCAPVLGVVHALVGCLPIQPANLDQLEPERLDLLEERAQVGLVLDGPTEDGLCGLDLGLEAREALDDALSQLPTNAYLVWGRPHPSMLPP